MASPKLKRIRKEYGDFGRGFSRWVRPVMHKYMMACCDCGLVHEMQFKAIYHVKSYADGAWIGKPLPRSKFCVMFRARRAEAYTRRQRNK